MRNRNVYPLAVMFLVIFILAALVAPTQAKAAPFTYTFKLRISDATIGTAYYYSLCTPTPGVGRSCDKQPPAKGQTKNPSGGTPNYTFTATGLPLGLSLNSNGIISGTPKANTPTGVRWVKVCVKDHGGAETCGSVAITVRQKFAVVFPMQIPGVTIGMSYNYVFCAPIPGSGSCGTPTSKNPWGGTPPYTFTTNLRLPSPLSLSQNGVISGTIKYDTYANRFVLGSSTFPVCTKDSVGAKICAQVTVKIKQDTTGIWCNADYYYGIDKKCHPNLTCYTGSYLGIDNQCHQGSICKLGYYLGTDNKCHSAKSCTDGYFLGTDNLCHPRVKCTTGYYLGKDKLCHLNLICPSGSYLGTDKLCHYKLTCPVGYNLGTDKVCVSRCHNGYYYWESDNLCHEDLETDATIILNPNTDTNSNQQCSSPGDAAYQLFCEFSHVGTIVNGKCCMAL